MVQAQAGDIRPIKRTNNRSPEFFAAPADISYFMDYTGFRHSEKQDGEGERFFETGIGPKALEMIETAEEVIILSVFLFDSFYSETETTRDIVGTLTRSFVDKRKQFPGIRIAVLLDPSHKSYGTRVSPSERTFRENGIDVFYSDLLSGLKKASPTGLREGAGQFSRLMNRATLNQWGNLGNKLFSRAKLPVDFDGDPLTLEGAYNAFLLKANHRKILLTDVGGKGYEALVTSANPHNASAYHVNSALSVKGETASYIYNVLREDMRQSASLGKQFAHWNHAADRHYRKTFFKTRFPPLPAPLGPALTRSEEKPASVIFVTESEIPRAVIDMLNRTSPGDQVRIQMFYLSFKPVLKAILQACGRTEHPVRLLLDANKDSFNKVKDGTPNRQVARYLLKHAPEHGGQIEVRWYSTHGEQNHAKTMSISNAKTGKFELTTGSCNWTGRNMDGVNMEANLLVRGDRGSTDVFNKYFDLFWSNSDGNEYSLDYSTFSEAAPDWKWIKGEKPFYWSTF